MENSRPAQVKLERPYLKIKMQTKWLGCGSNGSVCVLIMYKTMGSIPSTTKKKKLK
jgi:hypothetical protein